MRVLFMQQFITYSKKGDKKQIKEQCIPIVCTVCSGRIARKVNKNVKRTVEAV